VVGDGCFLPFRASLFMTTLMENSMVAQNTCLQMCVVGRDTFIGAGSTFTDYNLVPRPIKTFYRDQLVELDLPVIGGCVGHNCRLGAGLIIFPILRNFKIIADYQMARIANFLFPDPNATHGETYNIQQALISIGSGGWFGQGYGHGTQVQLRFLKVRWSDFIFSAMAHEFGFIGTVLVILVFLFVIYRCLRAARLARDTFGALIAFGVATLLVFQAMVNIGVNLNLMPATGLTFPFVSYGGSSLLSALIGIGLVESVILRHKALEF
jgi:rod shape determining protein RodA